MKFRKASNVPPDFEQVLRFVPDILCAFAFDGRIGMVSSAALTVLGMAPEELTGNFFLEFVHPEDHKTSGLALRRLANGERSVIWHNRFACRDRSYRRIQWHACGDSDRRLIYAAGRDISEMNPNDELLKETELMSLATVEYAIEGIIRCTAAGQIVMANPSAVRMLGYDSQEELMIRSSEQRDLYVESEDREILNEHLAREGTVAFECPMYRKDGSILWVALKARSVRSPGNATTYHEKYLKDISAQRRLESALQSSEAKYQALVENAPFGIYRTSLDGRFMDVNHTLVAMLGYQSREEVLRLNIEADVYLDPTTRAKLIQQFGNVERIEGAIADWKRKDGSIIMVRLSGRKVRDAYGVLEGFEVIAEDLREMRSSVA